MTDWVWVPFEVDARFDGYRVDRFLSQRLTAYSRGRVQKILEEARVLRGERPMKASARVRGGERILIAYPRHPEEPLSADDTIPVLFEDDALLVVNKPARLLSHPTDKISQHTVLGVLRHTRPDLKPLHLLHRLDRDTSGVLALGKTREAARAWTDMMEGHQVKKEYLAIVRGVPKPRQGLIDRPIGREGGKIYVRQAINVPGAVPAVTRYDVQAAKNDIALVRAFPETGRLHQIRVHLASIGHPILGDALYTKDGALYLKMTRHDFTAEDQDSLGFPRLALHAARLRFPHPITRASMTVSAPLPADFSDLIHSFSDETR